MAAPFWIKLAASELVRYKLVEHAFIHRRYLAVRYKTGLKEHYYFDGKPASPYSFRSFQVTSADFRLKKDIPIYRSFELDPIDEDEQKSCSHHIMIERRDLDGAGFLDRRIAVNRFVAHLIRQPQSADRFPNLKIKEWIDELRGFDFTRMITKDSFNFYRHISLKVPWRQVLWQYFPLDMRVGRWKLANAVAQVLKRRYVKIDTKQVHLYLTRFHKARQLNPLAYCAILQKLGVKNSIIDLHPETGLKAFAAMVLGLEYITKKCVEIDRAIDRGAVDVGGLQWSPLREQAAELIISDAHFDRFDIREAAPHLGRVKRLLAYAPRAKRVELASEYNPTAVIELMCRYKQGRNFKATAEDPDYIMVW